MTTGKGKSTRALVAGCREGNGEDWAELIDRISPLILSICYRFRLSREERYDVFGKVSLLLLENLARLRDEDRVFGYVATITAREANAVRIAQSSRTQRLSEPAVDAASIEKSQKWHTGLEQEEDLEIMARAFAGLTWKCRELLKMLFLESEDLSYREISGRLGIPVSSIGPTRGRCLDKLRARLLKEGFER
jgi:RNA polymerase sigma factor (sigma-70 family)